MNKYGQKILHLVAQQRLTPPEAERLWAAWRDERASGWMVAAAIGMASLATAHSLLAHPNAVCAMHAIHRFLGGVL
ncbi:MAG TPA: hypothetical protein VMD92_08860 [Acidobacteriaceae bacterium]|nr:hypothetical protein [Acidobacteriaceae bacterium]